MVVKFATNASGWCHHGTAMLLPNLVQVAESISGSVVPLAMFLGLFPKPWVGGGHVLVGVKSPTHF